MRDGKLMPAGRTKTMRLRGEGKGILLCSMRYPTSAGPTPPPRQASTPSFVFRSSLPYSLATNSLAFPVRMLSALALSLLLMAGARGVEFSGDGQSVRVATDRYVVELEGLCITRIENRLTGEVYAAPPEAPAEHSPAMRGMAGRRGVHVRDLKGRANGYYTPTEKTVVEREARPSGVTVRYVGLQRGEGEKALFDGRLEISLSLDVDEDTGDLVIAPDVLSRVEPVRGVRDIGVMASAVQARNLAGDLKVILPVNAGCAYTAERCPRRWTDKGPAHWRWPQFWEAALFIAESPRGCLGIWADEPDFNYGRSLSLCRSGERWQAAFQFESAALVHNSEKICGAAWRLNVFEGYWVKAAARYRQQMVAQWPETESLAKQTPAWADKIRIILGNHTPHVDAVKKYAELVPPDTLGTFTSQGWLKGWNDLQILQTVGYWDYFPNWPLEYPTHYEGVEGFGEHARALEEAGVHVFPYTNPTCVHGAHPWIQDKIGPRKNMVWRIWQRFYPEFMRDLVQRYGVSGIYEDCSWVVGVGYHHQGLPDGDTWASGGVRMRQYFRKLLPEVAVMGERNNEVTARGQHLALTITLEPGNAHPIGSYIFEPFVRIWNLQPSPGGMDTDDIRGFICTLPSGFDPDPLQEHKMQRQRALIFARRQLVSHWPETWDLHVLHYWRGNDGAEYRSVRDRGTRFVRIANGQEETLYWRLRGVTEADTGGLAVEGWAAYDGDRIVGLNPRRVYYPVLGAERPPVVISKLPEGFAVENFVIRDGFWVARIDTIENLKRVPKPDAPIPKRTTKLCKVRLRGTKPAQFHGVESSRKLGKDEYEVEVALPGGLAASWVPPVRPNIGDMITKFPAKLTYQVRDTGVLIHRRGTVRGRRIQYSGGADFNSEGTVCWLLELPLERGELLFRYGSEHAYGDGANYMVRVNGRTLWKEYRREVPRNPRAAAEHVSIPAEIGLVELEDYWGQTVVLELTVNGHHSAVSDVAGWRDVKLRKPEDEEGEDEALELLP